MDRYEKKAYRQIAKTERFLKRLGKRAERELSRLARYDMWEDGNEDLYCPWIVLENMLRALEKEGYWKEEK